jgi:very-short-patch-repair endonuclease
MMHRASELRQQMTPAEKKLWAALRAHQLQGAGFRRSHAIAEYIVDFCAPTHRLVIELDGNAHLAQQEADAERTRHLEALGYRVLRFWNDRVMEDLNGVLSEIALAIRDNA